MIYPEYHYLLLKYSETQSRLSDLLNEKEELFAITQPKGVNTEKEAVSGGKNTNLYEAYLIQKEQSHIEERIAEIKEILDDRYKLLKDAEGRLKASLILDDRIYKMRYIDRTRVYKIARRLNYSESHVYRIIERIEKNLKVIGYINTER